MENRQLLPFERNRYYAGKLLTSADFQAEQNYFNNKRRFLNNMALGAGILCGLSVYSLDDLSIMVESGAALDGLGREIVVENSVVRKLSAIEGFESLTGDRAALCLRYREEAVHPVVTLNRTDRDEEYELNRLREGWELFLADAASLEEPAEPETEFFTRATLFEDRDYTVYALMPATVSAGSTVKLLVRVQKLSEKNKKLSLDCTLQAPAFLAEGGSHEVRFFAADLALSQGETFDCTGWLTAGQPAEEAMILAKPEAVQISIGGEQKTASESFLLRTAISPDSPEKIVAREVGRVSLEARTLAPAPDYIRLADITLQLTKKAYLIEHVEERGVKHYLSSPSTAELRRTYESWFGRPGAGEASREPRLPREMAGSLAFQEPLYATGTCEIPLGDRARRGEIFYSSEIMHGLGPGYQLPTLQAVRLHKGGLILLWRQAINHSRKHPA